MAKAKINIVRQDELTHKRWSGGTTTQLAIWPEGADYASRKFDWRMSSAVVEDEESVFTRLPGIHRQLMILDGEIEMTCEGKTARKMKPYFEIAEFEGDGRTTSKGKCTDFNLMTANGCFGEMSPIVAGKKITLPHPPADECWFGLYAVADGIIAEFILEGQYARITFNKGDFMLLSYKPKECGEITLTVKYGADIPAVCASVWR